MHNSFQSVAGTPVRQVSAPGKFYGHILSANLIRGAVAGLTSPRSGRTRCRAAKVARPAGRRPLLPCLQFRHDPRKSPLKFAGQLVIVGFGSIGQGVLPLLLRHIDMTPQQITIITAEERGAAVAHEYGVRFVQVPLTTENYVKVLEPLLGHGDFLLNVSVEVSSTALIALCQKEGALYLDTCIEPWPGLYTDRSLPPAARSTMPCVRRPSPCGARARRRPR